MPLLVYLTVTMPFRLTFENEASLYSATFWFEVMLDTLFIADIFLNFRTGYDLNKDGAVIDDAGIIEYDRWRVAVNYIKSWFLLDVLSGVPFSLVELIISGDTEENVHLESVKTLKLLRFLRLGRLLKLEKILSNLDQVTLDILADFLQNGRTRSAVVMLKLIFCLCYATHLMACGFVAVGKAGDVRNMNNWLVHELRGPFTSEDTTGVNGGRPVYSIYIARCCDEVEFDRCRPRVNPFLFDLKITTPQHETMASSISQFLFLLNHHDERWLRRYHHRFQYGAYVIHLSPLRRSTSSA